MLQQWYYTCFSSNPGMFHLYIANVAVVGPKGVRAEANILCMPPPAPSPILYIVIAHPPALYVPLLPSPSHSLRRRCVPSYPLRVVT
jgi:hypothetical protein